MLLKNHSSILLTLFLVLEVAALGHAQEWTRFRGPNGSGVSATEFPVTWNDTDYKWIVDLPGIGHSSPVIWNDRLFIQSADPDTCTQHILCLDAGNGNVVWKKEFSGTPFKIHVRNSFASCTPAVDDEAVFTVWATPDKIRLYAFDHNGKVLWSREDLGRYDSQHGFGSSPIVTSDLVILPNLQMPTRERGAETSAVYAFDKKTGQLRWTTPRTSGKSSYSVPCVRTGNNGNLELILCSTAHGMFGLDLASGEEIWAVRDAFDKRTVSSPLLVGDLVYGSTGSGAGGNYVVAIDLKERTVAYKIDRQAPYVPTPVAYEDLVFLWSDKGIITCIDASSGESHWTKRVGGNFSGSPICAGGNLYCIAEDGTVVVVAASDEYILRGKVALGEDSRSTPAVSDGRMFLRTNSKLFCLGN